MKGSLELLRPMLVLAVFAAAASTPDLSRARDGSDIQPAQACEGAVRAASMALDRAEDELRALGKRTATRAEHDKAKAKVKKAEDRLRRTRSNC